MKSGDKQIEIKKIPIERAKELLKKDGLDLDNEDVEIILEFLYVIAEIVVDQYLHKRDNFINLHK